MVAQWFPMSFHVFSCVFSHLFSMNYIVFQCFPMISMDIHVFLNDFHVYSYVFLMSSNLFNVFLWFPMIYHVISCAFSYLFSMSAQESAPPFKITKSSICLKSFKKESRAIILWWFWDLGDRKGTWARRNRPGAPGSTLERPGKCPTLQNHIIFNVLKEL